MVNAAHLQGKKMIFISLIFIRHKTMNLSVQTSEVPEFKKRNKAKPHPLSTFHSIQQLFVM